MIRLAGLVLVLGVLAAALLAAAASWAHELRTALDVCPVEGCISMAEVALAEVDTRTGRVVSDGNSNWTTPPNNPVVKVAEYRRSARRSRGLIDDTAVRADDRAGGQAGGWSATMRRWQRHQTSSAKARSARSRRSCESSGWSRSRRPRTA